MYLYKYEVEENNTRPAHTCYILSAKRMHETLMCQVEPAAAKQKIEQDLAGKYRKLIVSSEDRLHGGGDEFDDIDTAVETIDFKKEMMIVKAF